MLKLMNICNDPWTLGKFDHDATTLASFLDEGRLDGLELIRWETGDDSLLPASRLMGRHLRFWPVWLDFWRNNEGELVRQFGEESAWQQYYSASTPAEFILNYRRELLDAEATGARYAVFHVSHVQLEHSYNQRYTYTDAEVADAAIDLLNQILDGLKITLAVLMENHWFPGLTFLDGGIGTRLMQGIRYLNKGFVLDIGHLMNTNPDLVSEEQAVKYILSVLDAMGESRTHIRAIHLNSSLTGGYVKESLSGDGYRADDSFEERLNAAFRHVGRIDRHVPFLHPNIRKVIDRVQPEYLVYEFSSGTRSELKEMVDSQNQALFDCQSK